MLICPHCEKPLEGHDESGCRRRMSRRFFFGLCVAPLAARIAGAVPLDKIVVTYRYSNPYAWAVKTGLLSAERARELCGAAPDTVMAAETLEAEYALPVRISDITISDIASVRWSDYLANLPKAGS